MISAGSAVSESSTAPSTDCSASRFCGGAIGAAAEGDAVGLFVWVGAVIGRSSLGSHRERTVREHMFSPAHCA